MSKEREALKLALEALESAEPKYTRQRKDQKTLGGALEYWKLEQWRRMKAITAIREALADSALDRMAENARELGLDYEPDVVLPGGGHIPAVSVAVYGYCPECGGAGVMRERRPNGDDKCTNGHKYPSAKALTEQPPCKTGSQCTSKCQQCEQPAQKRPQNCGTGYCSCIECVMEPAQEPFGYFKPEPFGWTDCAETDEGAIALYERPQPSKPWVGLEKQDMPDGEDPVYDDPRFIAGMVWANNKLREKNA